MAVAMPLYSTLKANIVTILQSVATAENAIDTYRNFEVSRDRWRPWIENQQNIALVNVMVDSSSPSGGGTKFGTQDRVTFNIDMYVLGTAEEQTEEGTGTVSLFPADQEAADRLDLLIAQVRHAITKMSTYDFSVTAGKIVSHSLKATLQIYQQEGETSTGCYAPARWSFTIDVAYEPSDDGTLVAISEIDLTFKQAIENWSIKHSYPATP